MSSFDETLIKKYLPENKWEEALVKLQNGYPVQYIIGNVEFYNLLINVNENVLIPRFETEYLVDDVIKIVKEYFTNKISIIDIGTGSGCIAIALKKYLNSDIKAIDISEKAINVAKKNAVENHVNIDFECVDIHDFKTNIKFDVLVSNPPYVSYTEKVDEKTKYEPQNAIFASNNGLYFYKVILEKSMEILNQKNIIAFEIGDGEGITITSLIRNYYPKAIIELKRDLNNKERYIYVLNK